MCTDKQVERHIHIWMSSKIYTIKDTGSKWTDKWIVQYIFTHWWESINPEMCAVLYIRTWMNSKPCIQKCAAKGIPLFKLYFFAYNITMKSFLKCLIWSGMDKFIAKEYCIFPVQSQTTILKKLYNQRKWGKFLIFGYDQ